MVFLLHSYSSALLSYSLQISFRPSTMTLKISRIVGLLCFLCFMMPSSGEVTDDIYNILGSETSGGQKVWCIAKPSVPDSALLSNLNYACGQKGVDCTPIRSGNPCFYPDTVIAHASYAMNLYYQAMGRNSWNCYFQNTGIVVFSDPSYGDCHYPAS